MKTIVDPNNAVFNGMIAYPENFQLINSMKTTSVFNLDKTDIGVEWSVCFNHMKKNFSTLTFSIIAANKNINWKILKENCLSLFGLICLLYGRHLIYYRKRNIKNKLQKTFFDR